MSKPATQAVSVRLDNEKVDKLERLAEVTDRPRSWHIEQALDSYLDLQSWQVEQTGQAIAEMCAGKGIPHEEVARELRRWGKESKARSGR